MTNIKRQLPGITPANCAPFSGMPLNLTAWKLVTIKRKRGLGWAAGIGLIAAGWFFPLAVWQSLFGALAVIYLADAIFQFWLVSRGMTHRQEIKINPTELKALDQAQLPKYTILCPLYREWQVVEQFVKAMVALEYPKEKLEVLILLEEDDRATQTKINGMRLPEYIRPLVVPAGLPRTKPRACNFGLQYASGDYVVIYDAEDIPEPQQLLKAFLAFRKVPADVICVQAKLNFYNAKKNLITRLFSAEYAQLFYLTLPGLQSIKGPIPLGGTSNHFLTARLRQIGAWDPYNVTEDCDLGIRLFRAGYRTVMLDSYTSEEATDRPMNWLRQRSRWIKGYWQTVAVHWRTRKQYPQPWQPGYFLVFLLVVGFKSVALFINPLLWMLTLSYVFGSPDWQATIHQLYPAPLFYLAVLASLLGNFFYSWNFIVGLAVAKKPELVLWCWLAPVYWLAMSAAAWRAAWQIWFKPHFWEKTTHGFHLIPVKRLWPRVTI